MDYVSAGTVSGEKNPLKICIFLEPQLRELTSSYRTEPEEGRVSRVACRWELKLRSQGQVNGHTYGSSRADKPTVEVVVEVPISSAKTEAAAVKMEDNRQFWLILAGDRTSDFRYIYPNGEVGVWINDYVLGLLVVVARTHGLVAVVARGNTETLCTAFLAEEHARLVVLRLATSS